MYQLTAALTAMIASWAAQPAAADDPVIYEVLINGESFSVEENRLTRLDSKKDPTISYRVAVRVAPTQRKRLGRFQFDYDWLAKLADDRKAERRTVRITHELGYSILVTDLGGEIDDHAQAKALEILTESLCETFRQGKIQGLEVGNPHVRQSAGATARGQVINYVDRVGLGHTCVAYVLVGPQFTVSCVIQYLDEDAEDVKSLIKKTLDSFRSVR